MSKSLYPSLIEIGLENYLKQRGGREIRYESHMDKIDKFVQKLSKEQKKILKEKIEKRSKETHTQHNDTFHEISIACAFYNNVEFLSEKENQKTPDFCSNNILVEVKTINNSIEELKRQDKVNKGPYCKINPNFRKIYINGIAKKFTDHINNAKEQLKLEQLKLNERHIWVVYTIDAPRKFPKEENAEIKNQFDEIIKQQQKDLIGSKICIRYIYFEKLREKIANSK